MPDPAVAAEAVEAEEEVEVDVEGEVGTESEAEVEAGEAGSARSRRSLLRGALAAFLTLAFLAGAGLFAWQATHLPGAASLQNRALTDAAQTAQVQSQVDSALETVLSYTPDDIAATQTAAAHLLSGQAAAQYATLISQIGPLASRQQLTLTTRVVRSGVESLADGHAVLLVFLDQTAVRAGGTPSVVAAQLSVTAALQGNAWIITSLDIR